ncbi:MAG: hypothetical protein O3C63_01335 [Cyanobacteria bacterium]|nr:hypothetical protein [Cyanobacteriota bacterium]MDA1020721.1 hypothetical protein [Cyanobacteriota bacterium]
MKENHLNQILEQRAIEPASPDLAIRIIDSITTKESWSTWYYRTIDLFCELAFPKPAYAFSFAVVLGFIIGFNDNLLFTDYSSIDLGEFIYNQGELL